MHLMRGLVTPLAAAMLLVCPLFAAAQPVQIEPAVQRGRTLLQAECARCHSVGATGDSPFRIAPPFRTLHQKYPIESLRKSLAEGIITGHPTMPEFRFDPGQVDDILAYLKTLER